jgi:hypothetical protein
MQSRDELHPSRFSRSQVAFHEIDWQKTLGFVLFECLPSQRPSKPKREACSFKADADKDKRTESPLARSAQRHIECTISKSGDLYALAI